MTPTLNPCPICGKNIPAGTGDRKCPHCLLQLGLGPAAASSSRLSFGSIGVGLKSGAASHFVRQGVLPAFGDYELESEIARGGMGVVYRARQISLNRMVAVKMILAGQLATPEAVQRFRLEAQAAARLHHPGIVPIYEIGEHETQHFFSMELIDGASLAECLEELRLKPQAPAVERRQQELCIAELIARVARALDFAHQHGILHRDLKPSNILIDEHGQPRLTDFGLVKFTGRPGAALTNPASVVGTPGYVAPEQGLGRESEVTTAADVYGLGATLYELLTGQPPFVAPTPLATMMQAVQLRPVPPRHHNPAVHRDLETIALKCLETEPQRRYRSAGAVADELERFMRGEPIEARPVSRAEHVVRWSRRNPLLTAALALLLAAIMGGTGAVFWQSQRVQHVNTALTATVADLQWNAIDDMLDHGQSSRALATVASVIRQAPNDPKPAMFAMSLLEQRIFPTPLAPPIHHPNSAALAVARLSPDGTRIVTASADGTARIWDARTSTELTPALKHDASVTWAEFSRDGQVLATCSKDKTVRLWNAQSGHPTTQPILSDSPVLHVQFSPDLPLLLAYTENTASIIDPTAGHRVTEPTAPIGKIISARFLPNGLFFTAHQAGDKSCICLWDARNGRQKMHLIVASMRDADVDDKAEQAVLAGGAGAWLINLPSGQRRAQLGTPADMILSVAFEPGGDRVAIISLYQWTRVYDTRSAKAITPEFSHFYTVVGTIFFHGGHRLLTLGQDSLAQVWNVDAGTPLCEPMRHTRRLVHGEPSQLDDNVFLITESHYAQKLIETGTGAAQLWTVRDRRNPDDQYYAVCDPGLDGTRISPDGKWAAISYEPDKSGNEPVGVFDIAARKPVCPPLIVKGGAWGLMFTPDCSRLITTTSQGQVAVWSLPSGKLVTEPVKIPASIRPAEIAPDGRTFLTGSVDGILRLWDSATGRVIRQMTLGDEIRSVAFSPDAKFVACSGGPHGARVWNAATGELVHELKGHQNEVITVVFSPDGTKLATSSFDSTARVWDAATGRTIAVLPHQGEVMDVVFSPDSHYVATCSRDRTAVIWDAQTGLPHTRSLRHEQGVRNVRFSPDGRRLYTVEFRGLRVWDVQTGHPLTVRLQQKLLGGTAFQSNGLRFNLAADAQSVLVGADCRQARLWHLPNPPAGAPPWFADFLEAIAGQSVSAGADQPELVSPTRFLDLSRELLNSTQTDYYTTWARRWLTNSQPPSDSPILTPTSAPW